MGLLRSARRGIATFSKIQMRTPQYLISEMKNKHMEALLENARRDLVAVKVGGF